MKCNLGDKLDKLIDLYQQNISDAEERVNKYSVGNSHMVAIWKTQAESELNTYKIILEQLIDLKNDIQSR